MHLTLMYHIVNKVSIVSSRLFQKKYTLSVDNKNMIISVLRIAATRCL